MSPHPKRRIPALPRQTAAESRAPWIDGRTIAFVVLMKVYLLFFVVLTCSILMKDPITFPHGWLDLWNRWDAHYIDIARDGYVTTDLHSRNQKYWIAFYPLYPWTIRAVDLVIHDFVLSAQLISLAGAIATALLFLRLIQLDFDRDLARSAVVFMFIFPTAYFFHAGYSESLFMALTLGCVLAARERRWAIASIAGAFASMTRVNGLLLVPVLLAEAAAQYRNEGRRLQRAWLWIPVAGTGFLVYLWVNFHVWNDPFYFQTVLVKFWGKHLTWPWVGIARALLLAMRGQQIRGTLEFLFLALGLAGTIWCWRRLRPSYTVWMALNWLVIASTSVLMSMPRYLLIFFPIFILFALLAAKRPLLGTFITVWSLTFLALFVMLFSAGQWAY